MKRSSTQQPLEAFFSKRTRESYCYSESSKCDENTSSKKNSPAVNSSLSENDEIPQNSNILQKKPHLSEAKTDPPKQPILESFPSTNGRRFSTHLYKQHEWIEYSEREDAIFCFSCRHFADNILRKGEKMNHRTFIDKGFTKWRDAKALLLQHSQSERHMSSIKAWTDYKNICLHKSVSIASQLCTSRSNEILENREHIKMLFKVAGFLGCQGLPFRGHDESVESSNKGNFIELLELLSEKNDNLKSKMARRYGHYTSHEYQNDIISILGKKIKKSIIAEVKEARFFSLLVDETKDCSKKEQIVIILRYFYEGCIKERAVGAYHMKDLTAASLSKFIIEILTSHGIDFNFCVGQCYDGASVMSGWANGVQAKVQEIAPNACYIHCYAHRLNLVLVDTISNILDIKDFFSVIQNLYTFICNSNTRYQLFIQCQKELGFKTILTLERNASTRWCYWYRSVTKIIKSYEAIIIVLELTSDSHTEASPEAIGLKAKLESPKYILYLHIFESILGLTYNLSEQLQARETTLTRAASLISVVRNSLKEARSDEEWAKVFKKAEDFALLNNVNFEKVPARRKRKKKIPSKIRDFYLTCSIGKRDTEDECSLTFETLMKRKYFVIMDRISTEFDGRFTSNLKLLNALEALDPKDKSFLAADKIIDFSKFYANCFDDISLLSQLKTAKKYVETTGKKKCGILEALAAFEKLPTAYSEVIKAIKISLTLPISTASNERFFSVLKRVKNHIRTTTGDDRLDSLLLMAVEQNLVKSLNPEELVNDFAKLRPRRYPLME